MAAVKKQIRNSRYYVGEVNNLTRNGFGVYVYPNSFFRYEGEWTKGEKHGHGKLLMKDGSYYEGEFARGEIEGNGSRFWAKTGVSYSGQFSGGELHGYGVMQKGNGERYEGEFSYGLRDGNGFLVDKDGQTYEGSFYQNKRHGEGQMHYRNGDQYEGGWLLDQQQGHGVMRFGDGSVYEGQWRNNLFNGQGTMIHCSGIIYEGVWTNGRPLGENGRVLQISTAIRLCGLSLSTTPASLLKMMEDIKETTIPTPFGFQVVSYPLMERAFGSQVFIDTAAPLAVAVVAAKSGSAQADSPLLLEGEWESGSGSDGLPLMGGTPSYLDGKEASGEQNQSGEGESTIITEFFSGLFAGQEEDSTPPPANQRVLEGQAKFQNLLLAPPPHDFIPYQLMDELKRNIKKPSNRAPTDRPGLSQDKNSERRSSTGSCFTSNIKKSSIDSRSVRPGEYVIMVKDVTNPPFQGQTLPPAFALLRLFPAKTKSKNSQTDKTQSK
ncbi:MORN repeat-containing protein 1 isoform X3 [Salmo salar]|uniref:MORN repeat-containing protein 1 isoform X3 n=1 Tax=Salmo salar TaxID=8030 RepID=A0A1S3LLZ0_SALSA|nr:MORN repeat-containing protein 1 isoform X3 [Salmo salar]|eukprot:XP_013991987.1 PREDICTED: MORN repeat-containing protein 1 isoform X3 [Salmo salar]